MGYKKYSKNRGYATSAAYDGQETHEYKYDEKNMPMEYITAIDAICFGGANTSVQF
jgi:hypothetical protein